MKMFKTLAVAIAFLGSAGSSSFAADSQTKAEVPQLVHCGIKDGKGKEYGTKEAAEADGATNIVPKTDKPCESIVIE